jgi:SNF2 domain-containing protein
VTYKRPTGRPDIVLLYRDNESSLEIVSGYKPWTFDADGANFRLVSEALRIKLAYLFDPLLAVHTSRLEPLPHQITAVYEKMLPRQPLRFLLADDPGAGKTIMAGLLIKELIIRGDLNRCLVVAPGNLVEQWQDELYYRFHLLFDIITTEKIETSRSGNPYAEYNLVIGRLDQMSRNEDIQAKLDLTDWDLIVCDEAHKMSATFFSGEVKPTQRYKLGKRLSHLTRNFLLLTATPHNGKDEDFQLFLQLLDEDRFEGRFRSGFHRVDTSDIMRRLVKEALVKFDGTPLFPERFANTVTYRLSTGPFGEQSLYNRVTAYVQNEMNRAERLAEGKRNVVGFALTILQRRLASSPEAIYQSIRRRKERLAKRMGELQTTSSETPLPNRTESPPPRFLTGKISAQENYSKH